MLKKYFVRRKIKKRLIRVRKKAKKVRERLEKERYRRIQAEEGHTFKALFGKPKKIIRVKKKKK